MFKSYPLISRVILVVLLPLLVILIYGVNHLQASLPPLKGQLKAPWLSANVKVYRDQNGVVYLDGSDDQDIFFATGVVHAQDRMWQLELQKRMAQGRLSEVLGRDALGSDIWIRSLGIYGAAEQAWQNLSPEAKKSVTAYVAGINYWIAQQTVYPAEFTLLDIKPQQWQEIDTIAWVKMFALNLAGNMNDEIRNYIAAQSLPEKQLTQLFGGITSKFSIAQYSEFNQQSTLVALENVMRRNSQLQKQFNFGGQYVGSNAWVISGKHSKDNMPILANDPHLGLQIPSYWYALSQQGEHLSAKGMGLVGTPLIIFGQNDHISWGGTNMMADVQDLYFETLNINQKGLYESGSSWQPLGERIEIIEVRADTPELLNKRIKPVKINVRTTERGPLISDIKQSMMHPVSLKWTGLDPDDTSYEAFFKLNYANNWSSFENALSFLVAPALNMLYADTEGNIGYAGAGRIPIRAVGEGVIPLPAGRVNTDWAGYIPYQQMPKLYNPESGIIVSANDGLLFDSYPYFISHAFAPSYRSQRISDLIKNPERLLIAKDMMSIQGDTLDLEVKKLLPLAQQIQPQNEHQRQALELLKSWSGNMSADSQAPSIFIVWQREIRKLLLKDELAGFWNQQGQLDILQDIASTLPLTTVVELLQHPQWCVDSATNSSSDNCQQLINKAFKKALQVLSNQLGEDIAGWNWGELQHTEYAHTPFSHIRVLDGLFERRAPAGGSIHSVNVAASYYDKSQGFVQNFGAGMRQIIVMGDPEQHFYMNSTGQSGNPISEHYDDMVMKFSRVEFERFDAEPSQLAYVELIAGD